MDHVTQISRDFFLPYPKPAVMINTLRVVYLFIYFFIKRNVRFCHRGSLMYFVGSINLLDLIKQLTTKSAHTNF